MKGLTYKSEDYTDESNGLPFLTLKSISKRGGYSPDGLKFYGGDFKQHHILQVGDILFANTDLTRDGDVVGNPLYFEGFGFTDKTLYSMDLSRLIVASDKVDGKFLYYLMMTPGIKRLMVNLSAGSTVLHLDTKRIWNLSVTLPSLPEQKKIASILTSVDEVIENTQKQIDKLKDLKKATMNDLLTKGIGHREFKNSELGKIPESWEVESLGDVCLKIQDGTHFSPTLDGDDFKYITSKNIRMGEISLDDVETISRNEHEKIYKRCDVRKKDLLLTKDGANTGNIAMNTLDEEFSLLSSVAFLRPSKRVNGEYLLQFMMSEKAQNLMAELTSGNAITRLTLTKIKEFKVLIPSREEQEQIASMLSSIDRYIKHLKSKFLQTQSLKKSLMQDLLTGKVRVKVN